MDIKEIREKHKQEMWSLLRDAEQRMGKLHQRLVEIHREFVSFESHDRERCSCATATLIRDLERCAVEIRRRMKLEEING